LDKIVGDSRILVQQQRTCGNQTYPILCKLWKTSLERIPDSRNGDTKFGRLIKKDGDNMRRSKDSNRKNKGNNEKAI